MRAFVSISRRGAVAVATLALTAAACTSGASPTAAPTSGASPTATPPPIQTPAGSPIAGGLLAKVLAAGKLVVSTDANYAPQSFLKPDGSYEGFDIEVATEIASRLGVTVEFTTPAWDAITAGSWAGRWDISVGSMTITVPRQQVVDFSSAYYYTPAQMAVTTASGITSLDGLAGKTICVGSATTYQDWLNGTLESVSLGPVATPPANVTVKPLETDQLCAQAIAAGQNVGEGFLTSVTVIDSAIANGTPIVKVGAPVFTEQLAVAIDRSGPSDEDFLPLVTSIVEAMHADGTLSRLSVKWFQEDLTIPPAR